MWRASKLWLAGLAVATVLFGSSCTGVGEDRASLVLKNVAVFDARTATVTPGQSVFIKDGIITEIREASPADRAAQVLEGKGRVVAPGLIDTHVHFSHQFFPSRELQDQDRDRLGRVYLTHGVTTIAEMGQNPAWVPTMAGWEDDSQAESPNLVVVAGSLCSAHDWDRRPPVHHVILGSPEEAKARVKAYRDQGVERIKLYWKLEMPELIAAVEEADRLGMRHYAHVDNGIVLIPEAMDQGVRHFEHFFTLQRSVADPDDLIEKIAEDFPFRGPGTLDEWTLSLALYHDAIERAPELKAQFGALIDRMVEEEATISTAINMLAAAAGESPVYSCFDPKPPRFTPVIREGFLPPGVGASAVKTVMKQVRRAHEAGLPIRIGTDAQNGGEVTLAEMTLLAKAGIPVGDVLRIATLNGAEALGIDDRAGVIEAGRPADLVIFEEDPYEDPDHFLQGVTTIKNGSVYLPPPSPVAVLSGRLTTSGLEATRDWWGKQSGVTLHPGELQDSIHRLVDLGSIPEARFLVDLLPQMLHGEQVTDYVHENGLNTSGYGFLNRDDPETAVEIFRLVVDLYPDSWNAHDSLGEGYVAAGQTEAAIESYQRSLELNPESPSGQVALEKLRN